MQKQTRSNLKKNGILGSEGIAATLFSFLDKQEIVLLQQLNRFMYEQRIPRFFSTQRQLSKKALYFFTNHKSSGPLVFYTRDGPKELKQTQDGFKIQPFLPKLGNLLKGCSFRIFALSPDLWVLKTGRYLKKYYVYRPKTEPSRLQWLNMFDGEEAVFLSAGAFVFCATKDCLYRVYAFSHTLRKWKVMMHMPTWWTVIFVINKGKHLVIKEEGTKENIFHLIDSVAGERIDQQELSTERKKKEELLSLSESLFGGTLNSWKIKRDSFETYTDSEGATTVVYLKAEQLPILQPLSIITLRASPFAELPYSTSLSLAIDESGFLEILDLKKVGPDEFLCFSADCRKISKQ